MTQYIAYTPIILAEYKGCIQMGLFGLHFILCVPGGGFPSNRAGLSYSTKKVTRAVLPVDWGSPGSPFNSKHNLFSATCSCPLFRTRTHSDDVLLPNSKLAWLEQTDTGRPLWKPTGVDTPARHRVLRTPPSTDGWHLSLHTRRTGWPRSTLRPAPLHSLLHIPNKLNVRGCDGAR